jgi:AcrR family transcriptional regulator
MKRNGSVSSISTGREPRVHKPTIAGTRPRVEGDREDEILEATLELLLEVGYDRLTMDAVARRARASKATLYRRWEDKPSLVVDAMVRAKQAPGIEEHDTGSLRGDLVSTFCGAHGMSHNAATGVLGSVITALSSDPEFARRFRESFIEPKVAVSREIYHRAIERGEIPADVDIDVIAPALAGILLHRAFVLGLVADDKTIKRVIDHVILPAVGHPAAAVRQHQKAGNRGRSTSSDDKKETKTS